MDEQSATLQQLGSNVPPSQPIQPMNQPAYTIYLLTVWFDSTENAGDPASWRFRLENPRTKETRGFVGVAALAKGVSEMIGESIQWHTERPKATE